MNSKVLHILSSISCVRAKKYDISIGIDSYGIITSYISSIFSPYKATFWSLEITESKHYKLFMILIKVLGIYGT